MASLSFADGHKQQELARAWRARSPYSAVAAYVDMGFGAKEHFTTGGANYEAEYFMGDGEAMIVEPGKNKILLQCLDVSGSMSG